MLIKRGKRGPYNDLVFLKKVERLFKHFCRVLFSKDLLSICGRFDKREVKIG